jgi:hypothetical protein
MREYLPSHSWKYDKILVLGHDYIRGYISSNSWKYDSIFVSSGMRAKKVHLFNPPYESMNNYLSNPAESSRFLLISAW